MSRRKTLKEAWAQTVLYCHIKECGLFQLNKHPTSIRHETAYSILDEQWLQCGTSYWWQQNWVVEVLPFLNCCLPLNHYPVHAVCGIWQEAAPSRRGRTPTEEFKNHWGWKCWGWNLKCSWSFIIFCYRRLKRRT